MMLNKRLPLLFIASLTFPAWANDPPYRIAVMVNQLADQAPSANQAEIADDIGFYLSEAKDELVKQGITVIPPNENPRKVPIIYQGRTLRYLNIRTFLPKGECCGFIALQNERSPTFIPLKAIGTAAQVKKYFR